MTKVPTRAYLPGSILAFPGSLNAFAAYATRTLGIMHTVFYTVNRVASHWHTSPTTQDALVASGARELLSVGTVQVPPTQDSHLPDAGETDRPRSQATHHIGTSLAARRGTSLVRTLVAV